MEDNLRWSDWRFGTVQVVRICRKYVKCYFFHGHLKVIKAKGGDLCHEEKQGKDRCLASS